eukprot:TRINITY_DN1966_c0_g1_i1.p1 TRINITY_DN1966_c0_g1~~TRINITY_DN1966_c0_g1_i1.p1  ORF type:complete len:303 (-),score=65.45 TRINITY_DN1966_c0_g1_i1:103-1011(-)
MDRLLTPVFAILFLVVPLVWSIVFYFRAKYLRESARLQRVSESFFFGLMTDSILCLAQLFLLIGMINLFFLPLEIYESIEEEYPLITVMLLCAFIFSYYVFVKAIPEEVLKYILLSYIGKKGYESKYAAIVYSIFITLGFVIFSETILIVSIYWERGFTADFVIVYLVSIFFTCTINILSALWLGYGVQKQKFRQKGKTPHPSWKILLYPVTIHASFAVLVGEAQVLGLTDLLSVYLLILVLTAVFAFILIVLGYTVYKISKLFTDNSFYELILFEDEQDINDNKNESSDDDDNDDDIVVNE